MPHVEAGMRVGLLGGSFNPPHSGHLHIAELALRRLKLHQVWWLVTPGNPLKDQHDLAPLADRVAACEATASHPAMKVTAFEASLRSRFTADTLNHVVNRYVAVDFVWLMGADNLGQFHRWQRWREIAALLPIAVIDRPGSTMALHNALAAKVLRKFRIDESDAAHLPGLQPPAWTFLHGPRNSLSSSAIRSVGSASQA
ncbi:MAG: nicotinate-nucleotide adenylyltransferase [Ahrensia sp.]|nr:nicotinate-nucleotide adenylyltransferase [Ahrensia sp.]